MLRWEGVSEFVAVVETGSFTAASLALGISTAQVSRKVSQLEARLKTRLLFRSTRQVSLTGEGQTYFEHCRLAINELEEAEQAISQLHHTPQGKIRLTAPVAYGEKYVMPIIVRYMQRYPLVSIQCDLSNQILDLVQGGYDLAIRLGHLNDSAMIARRLASRTQYTCASSEYLLKNGTPVTPSDLCHHNCLQGNSDYWHFIEDGKQKNIRIRGNFVCNSGYALAHAATNGLGIVQLPEYYVGHAMKQGDLLPILEPFQEPQEGIWAVFPHHRQLSPKIRLLVEMLAADLTESDLSLSTDLI